MLLLLGGLLLPTLFAQQAPALHSLHEQVEGLFLKKKYDYALALLQPVQQQALQARQWEQYAQYTEDIAEAYKGQKKYEGAVACLDSALNALQHAQLHDAVFAANLWVWKALNLKKQERYADALEAYQVAIQIFEKNQFKGSFLSFSYKNAAQILQRLSNNHLAVAYLKAALQTDTSNTYPVSVCANLVNAYLFLDSLPEALRYHRLGAKYAALDPDLAQRASFQSAGAALAFRQSEFPEAHRLTLAALKYYRSQPDKTDNLLRSFTMLAAIADASHQPRAAEVRYREAEAEGKRSYRFKSREMAKLYIEWGHFLEKQQQLGRALVCYQQALVQAFPRFNSLQIADNPPIEDAWLESQAMEAAQSKALALLKTLAAPSLKPATISDRTNAAHCFDLCFAVATRLRQTYGNDADKISLATNLRPALNAALLNLRHLYDTTQDPLVLQRLFTLLEQTHAAALADALRQQRALALTGIPDSLLAREEGIRREAAAAAYDLKIKELERNLSENTRPPGADATDEALRKEWRRDSAEAARLQAVSFRNARDYDALLHQMQARYPQFRQYTQADQPAQLSAIAAALPHSATLLSWHDAGDRYLCAVLRRGQLSCFELPRDTAFDARLTRFIRLLSDKTSQESAPGAYFEAAFFLGKKLLPPELLAQTRALIIVPDGQLCYLPFEALLTQPHSGSFGSAPFLIRSHTVQYAWSATLLTLPVLRESAEKGLLHVAPFARAARDGFAPLPNSLRDCPADLHADTLEGQGASVSAFLKKAPLYESLHLSTHASAGGRGIPGIEFADRTLSLPEIYAQRLHASLVSLSACETGSGRFAEGEGILSLARAFAYAGARSLVASHWAVNERSTTEIFSDFYENLRLHLPKAEALRQAKLHYLASAEMDARKAPFHWAAFTLTGADGRVPLKNPYRRWWVGAWVFSAFACWWLFKRWQKHESL